MAGSRKTLASNPTWSLCSLKFLRGAGKVEGGGEARNVCEGRRGGWFCSEVRRLKPVPFCHCLNRDGHGPSFFAELVPPASLSRDAPSSMAGGAGCPAGLHWARTSKDHRPEHEGAGGGRFGGPEFITITPAKCAKSGTVVLLCIGATHHGQRLSSLCHSWVILHV